MSVPPNKRVHWGSHIHGGISQRRGNDATSSKLDGGDTKSGEIVFKLASVNELRPYGGLIVAANLQCPARVVKVLISELISADSAYYVPAFGNLATLVKKSLQVSTPQ